VVLHGLRRQLTVGVFGAINGLLLVTSALVC